jgi:hypothetical protein
VLSMVVVVVVDEQSVCLLMMSKGHCWAPCTFCGLCSGVIPLRGIPSVLKSSLVRFFASNRGNWQQQPV